MNGQVTLRKTAAETAIALFGQRAMMIRRGIVALRLGAVAYPDPATKRASALVSWEFLGKDGAPSGTSIMRYYLAGQTDGTTRIEMVEFLSSSLDLPATSEPRPEPRQ